MNCRIKLFYVFICLPPTQKSKLIDDNDTFVIQYFINTLNALAWTSICLNSSGKKYLITFTFL